MKYNTRFAPSPTGYLHVGGFRTALYSWLAARSTEGSFHLRIEDTDRERSDVKFIPTIINSLSWAGLFDVETTSVQSNRDYIQEYSQKLEELESFSFYDGAWWLVNFTGHDTEDILFGRKTFTQNPKDIVMIKKDGMPTYHFASVVDDFKTGINLVLRGQEWYPSLPIHCKLYDILEYERPKFLHLPLILNKDGTKLSKRESAASIQTWINVGILPSALINYLCLIGGGHSLGKEIFSVEELLASFDITKLSKDSAQFDEKKLYWVNRQHLQGLTYDRFLIEFDNWVKYSTNDELHKRAITPDMIWPLILEGNTFSEMTEKRLDLVESMKTIIQFEEDDSTRALENVYRLKSRNSKEEVMEIKRMIMEIKPSRNLRAAITGSLTGMSLNAVIASLTGLEIVTRLKLIFGA